MSEPEFKSPDGLAATVLVAALIEELMDNGMIGPTAKQRILDDAIHQLDRVDTPLSASAANLIIDVFGLDRMRRSAHRARD